jgi:hypothetical protein
MILPFSSAQLLGAAYSHGLSAVILQQAPEPFPTVDETVPFLTWPGDRHEDHMASASVRTFSPPISSLPIDGEYE